MTFKRCHFTPELSHFLQAWRQHHLRRLCFFSGSGLLLVTSVVLRFFGRRLDLLICIVPGGGILLRRGRNRIGDSVEVTDNLFTPSVLGVQWNPDPNTDQVAVALELTGNTHARMYPLNALQQPGQAMVMTDGKAVLTFGEGGNFELPQVGQQVGFVFDAFRAKTMFSTAGCPSRNMWFGTI